MATPRHRRKAKVPNLVEVPAFGTPPGVWHILKQMEARAENDETLAIAVIEVVKGDIIRSWVGGDQFPDQLVAGVTYLMRDLTDDE
jgi:hypothetical protein